MRRKFAALSLALLASLLLTSIAQAEDEAKSEAPQKSQRVIAEGVGITADEALKDAFRSAVRQVVGAVVDAETLVKDDELIDDKVLTYSDGFVKTYEKLSEKQQGGLIRIKIAASIERRSVIAKLKAANITVTEVDGKGLFSEAVTELEAEQGVEDLLRKSLEGFPNTLLEASVVGRPQLVEKTGEKVTVSIQVQVEPNLKAYKAFVARFQPILEKVAKDSGEFSAAFRRERWPYDESFIYFSSTDGIEYMGPRWMPKAFSGNRLKPGQVTLALTTQRSDAADRLESRYYVLDKSLQPLLADLAFRTGKAKLSLLDADGGTVIVDRFSLSEPVPRNTATYEGTLISAAGHLYGNNLVVLGQPHEDDSTDPKRVAFLYWISPVFIQPNAGDINYRPSLQLTRKLSLSLDELKAVQTAKCEVISEE